MMRSAAAMRASASVVSMCGPRMACVDSGQPEEEALDQEAGAVRVTIARWYTPDGRSIEDGGLLPDIEVVITEDDITAGQDPQLRRAVELLLGQTTVNAPSATVLPAVLPAPAH